MVWKNRIYHVYNESITVYVDLLVYRESFTHKLDDVDQRSVIVVRNNIIIRIIQLCIIPKLHHLDSDHCSTTTGVVEQCLPGLRRFDPSPLLSEFQVGQKVDPCLLGLGPRHIIISLRPTQYTKYKSSTYKVQTREEKMVKNICSQVAHASALNE